MSWQVSNLYLSWSKKNRRVTLPALHSPVTAYENLISMKCVYKNERVEKTFKKYG